MRDPIWVSRPSGKVAHGVLLADLLRLWVHSDLLWHLQTVGLANNRLDRNGDLGLHHVLWVLVPHVVLPAALDRLLLLRQVLVASVGLGSPAKLLVDFVEPEHDLVGLPAAHCLVFHIAIHVHAAHVRVMVPLEIELELKMRVHFDEVDHLLGLEHIADASRAATPVAEVHADVLELMDATADHVSFYRLI